MTSSLLKLRAQDGEDMEVISAMLQDSIVPLCDMVFQSENKSFIMVAQRLRREVSGGGEGERICNALTIRGVASVQTSGIDQSHRERMLDLLAIILEPSGKHLSFIFAGDAQVRLELGEWLALAEDFGESWPALCNPCHDQAS